MNSIFIKTTKKFLTKDNIIRFATILAIAIFGVIIRLISKFDYPYYFLYFVNESKIIGEKVFASYNLTSIFGFRFLFRIVNGDSVAFVSACQTIYNIGLFVTYLLIVCLVFRFVKVRRYIFFFLISLLFAAFVFSTANYFMFFDSMSILIIFDATAVSCLLYTFAKKQKNIFITIACSLVIILINIFLGNIFTPLILVFVTLFDLWNNIRTKTISANEIISYSTAVVVLLSYVLVYIASRNKYYSYDIEHGPIDIFKTALSNLSLFIAGPSYSQSIFSSTMRIALGVLMIVVSLMLTVFVLIKKRTIAPALALTICPIIASFLYANYNKNTFYLADNQYGLLSILLLVSIVLNINDFFVLYSSTKLEKFIQPIKFFVTRVVLIISVALPLFSYSYASRTNSFLDQALYAFIKEDMRTDEHELTAFGLDVEKSTKFASFLWKNKAGRFASFNLSNKIQETGFIYGSNNISAPFDIYACYWFPQVTHVLLESKEGTCFSFKMRIEDAQIGTYCRIFIDQTKVCDETVNYNYFEFTFPHLNQNEVYGIRVEVGTVFSYPGAPAFPQLGFQLIEMEIK